MARTLGGFQLTRAARTLAIVVAGLALVGASTFAQNAFVRVNQLGYLSSASKRAYLMASAVETGATFSVKNSSGATVYSAGIGANLGSWSTAYPDVYALDFSIVTSPGAYTITVSGPIAASSPGFKIDTGANVYTGALANSLYFYENERDGPNFIATSLRTAQFESTASHFCVLRHRYEVGSEVGPTPI